MPEPTKPAFKGIPEAPTGGYVIETGAAAGMRSHLTAEDIGGIKCHICGARAEQGTDGRLRIEHKWGPHSSLTGGGINAGAVMSQPVKREDGPKRDWWDSE